MTTEVIIGDLLNSSAPLICQQVNCIGVMGAGLAAQIAARYPQVLSEYKDFCRGKKPAELLGQLQVCEFPNFAVANLFAQQRLAPRPGICVTDYDALRIALARLYAYCMLHHIKRVAFPWGLGCGLAGGNWTLVWNIIHDTFHKMDIKVEIWKLS